MKERNINTRLESRAYPRCRINYHLLDSRDFPVPIKPDNFSSVAREIIAATFILPALAGEEIIPTSEFVRVFIHLFGPISYQMLEIYPAASGLLISLTIVGSFRVHFHS